MPLTQGITATVCKNSIAPPIALPFTGKMCLPATNTGYLYFLVCDGAPVVVKSHPIPHEEMQRNSPNEDFDSERLQQRRNHHKILYICFECGPFSAPMTKGSTRQHAQSHARGRLMCNVCGSNFSQSASLSRHKKRKKCRTLARNRRLKPTAAPAMESANEESGVQNHFSTDKPREARP
eukprot:Opistho-2@37026